MTDRTAFERQVAGGMRRRAGPARPVDDLAVFDAVVIASRSRRGRFTMFSALKLIAAGINQKYAATRRPRAKAASARHEKIMQ